MTDIEMVGWTGTSTKGCDYVICFDEKGNMMEVSAKDYAIGEIKDQPFFNSTITAEVDDED